MICYIISMAKIQLKSGEIFVDEEDWEKWKRYKWYISSSGVVAPALLPTDPSTVRLARLVLGVPKGFEADHKDGIQTNCSRSNLRIVTHGNNMLNKGVHKTGSKTSKYRGVVRYGGRFMAQISRNRCMIFLGWFSLEDDAAAAYDKAAHYLYGEYYSRPNLQFTREIEVLNWPVLEALKKASENY